MESILEMVFGDEFPVYFKEYNIKPLDEDKRVRVFGGQLMDTVVDNTTLGNFNYQVGLFFKFGVRLVGKYPHREVELNKNMITFWSRMQEKYKDLKDVEGKQAETG